MQTRGDHISHIINSISSVALLQSCRLWPCNLVLQSLSFSTTLLLSLETLVTSQLLMNQQYIHHHQEQRTWPHRIFHVCKQLIMLNVVSMLPRMRPGGEVVLMPNKLYESLFGLDLILMWFDLVELSVTTWWSSRAWLDSTPNRNVNLLLHNQELTFLDKNLCN